MNSVVYSYVYCSFESNGTVTHYQLLECECNYIRRWLDRRFKLVYTKDGGVREAWHWVGGARDRRWWRSSAPASTQFVQMQTEWNHFPHWGAIRGRDIQRQKDTGKPQHFVWAWSHPILFCATADSNCATCYSNDISHITHLSTLLIQVPIDRKFCY